ncbi:hypothetical protein KXV85_003944, partial [Aspergillus fumigatus]
RQEFGNGLRHGEIGVGEGGQETDEEEQHRGGQKILQGKVGQHVVAPCRKKQSIAGRDGSFDLLATTGVLKNRRWM